MPQAMEWSLATPITRPRLPAINPDLASATMSSRGVSCFILEQSFLKALEDQRGVGAAETEAVGKGDVDVGIVDAAADDVGPIHRGIERLDVGAFADETRLHHQQGVD